MARLPCHVDVDSAADADAVARQIPGSRFAAVFLAVYPACLGETMDGNAGRGRRASGRRKAAGVLLAVTSPAVTLIAVVARCGGDGTGRSPAQPLR